MIVNKDELDVNHTVIPHICALIKLIYSALYDEIMSCLSIHHILNARTYVDQ